jgi:hypothetical protein
MGRKDTLWRAFSLALARALEPAAACPGYGLGYMPCDVRGNPIKSGDFSSNSIPLLGSARGARFHHHPPPAPSHQPAPGLPGDGTPRTPGGFSARPAPKPQLGRQQGTTRQGQIQKTAPRGSYEALQGFQTPFRRAPNPRPQGQAPHYVKSIVLYSLDKRTSNSVISLYLRGNGAI